MRAAALRAALVTLGAHGSGVSRVMSKVPDRHRDQKLDDEDYRRQADFRYALRRFSAYSERQAHAAGITPQQHLLLLTLRGHPSYPIVTVGDVADRLQIRPHSASLLIERGVQRGLLARREDPTDRRKALISLTDRGAEILEQITVANRRELQGLGAEVFGLRDSLLRAFDPVALPDEQESTRLRPQA